MKCGLERFPCPWWKSTVPRILLSQFCQGQYIPKAHKTLGSKENVWPLKQTRLCQESVILREKKVLGVRIFANSKAFLFSSGANWALGSPWLYIQHFIHEQSINISRKPISIFIFRVTSLPFCIAGERWFNPKPALFSENIQTHSQGANSGTAVVFTVNETMILSSSSPEFSIFFWFSTG